MGEAAHGGASDVTHDFLDPFTRAEIDDRRARLSADWGAEVATRRWWWRSWRRNAPLVDVDGGSAVRPGRFQPLFETADIDPTLT